ncbi:nitrate- and nitrite sensing domain-containing protein [Streptomyces sp. DSM 41886]|uniref:histidine kinase n=1 Tax=Streptomyces johnsoniae TaxID=3075532 RepID=A0ABU2RWY9_9ACTN|nr:nitrate- and nitrite sensing domain-containing protein [Streptomyces sp. DSM 41886]MDT0441142.1 nitrate- and nitrite sensing domain-containing protein [Streptomyces sp. DSM 41886]
MRRKRATPETTAEPGPSRASGRGNFTPPPGAREAPGDSAAPAATGSRLAPRNWRVATKLYAILLIPVLVGLVLGGFRVYGAYDTWQEADDAERTAELVRASTAYAHALIDERDVSAAALLRGNRDDPAVAEVRARTDEARAEFRARVEEAPQTDNLERRLDAIAEAEPHLDALREQAYTEELPGVETEEGYVDVQHPLMSLANELGLGTGNVTSYGRTVYAISLAKAASSLQRAIGTHLIVAPGPGAEATELQLTAFGSYAYLERIAQAEYASAGTEEDTQRLSEAMAGAAESVASNAPDAPALAEMVSLIGAGGDADALAANGVTEQSWFTAATAEFDAYRTIERDLVDAALDEAHDIAATARRDMIVNAAVVLGSLIIAVVLASLMARSMSRNMSRLRGAAFDVAEQRLPAIVDQLSRTRPGDVDTRVVPIRINSQDEIGEVARAFDQVHREAVRLAAEQALLRGNVNAIFTNLSSRNQGLIERQLSLISELENNEADPEQLEHLFKLDHLATRMRRNGENLLVLAGEEPEHRWNQPVALVDVMRAAASEVAAYARIELSGVPECDIHGSVVNDLVHLLAELLENATTFSSPQTKVRVTATRLPDGRIMIEIHDKGIGLTQEDFAEINKRLADPPAVDAAVSRRMGLYVVGRLSERHGIRVQLRPSGEQSGTTSLVMLPERITHGGSAPVPAQAPEEFTVSRIAPHGQHITQADLEAGARTAAELGFDDSRYEVPQVTGDTVRLGRADLDRIREAPRADPGPRTPLGPPPTRHEPATAQPGFGTFPPPADNPLGGPGNGPHRVGFSPPDRVATGYESTTSAGLPRRERQWQQPEEEPAQRLREEPPAPQAPAETQWDRGPRREERTGGTTSSGLPKRVPRANLTEHPASEPAAGGPQVSRDPTEVRGRLSSLHRGVQQGRGARTGRGTRNDDQER